MSEYYLTAEGGNVNKRIQRSRLSYLKETFATELMKIIKWELAAKHRSDCVSVRTQIRICIIIIEKEIGIAELKKRKEYQTYQ